MSSLRDALGVPSTKVPISIGAFVSYVIPPVACYITAAILAVTPQTRAVRVALWPILALSAFRAAVSVDMSLGDPDRLVLNTFFVMPMFCMSVNTIPWTLAEKPLVRQRSANRSPSILMDALDLTSNLRGHGWDWSRGLDVPRETRPTGRAAFALHVLLSMAAHLFISNVFHLAIRAFILGPSAGPSPKAWIMFDQSLPFPVRYLRSCIITALCAFVTHLGMQMCYDVCTLLGILLFGQHPAQWPPAFDNPWHATSLCDFWGRRWHQFFRKTFLLGAYPFSVAFGRPGALIGAFLASGYFHHVFMGTYDEQSDPWRMFVGFGMMGPVVLAERMFYKATGRKVGGMLGWAWTMAWLLLWGNVIVDGFLRGGMLTTRTGLDDLRPVRTLVEGLVMRFDAWLHTI